MTISRSVTRLMTPEDREKLWVRDSYYWSRFARGRSIGYRRGVRLGSWFARVKLKSPGFRQVRLGSADDGLKADGVKVLTFAQAIKAAEEWCLKQSPEAIDEHLAWEKEPEYPALNTAPPYTIGHALKAYLEWYRLNRKGFSSAYYSCRSSMFEQLWHIRLDELTSNHIRQWMFRESEKPPRLRSKKGEKQSYFPRKVGDNEYIRRRRASVNRHLHILRAALYQALERGMMDNDASWINVRPYRGAVPTTVCFLEKEQVQELVKHSPPDLAQLVIGAVLTGARLGELRRMKVGSLKADLRLLEIDDQKTKQIRRVFLPDEGLEFFSGLAEGRDPKAPMFRRKNGIAWKKGGQWRPFKLACSKAGIGSKFRFHELRHTYASHAVMAGVPLKVVATQLGHADTRTVDRFYSRLGNEYVASEIAEKMPRFLAIEQPEVSEE